MSLQKMLEDLSEHENLIEIPPDYPVGCYECKWKGKLEDCPLEEDYDGWEMPIYHVPVCPECGAGIEI